jgi:hypothetical protein
VVLVHELEGKDTRGIGVELRDEARSAGLQACALADQADGQARDEDVLNDVKGLCAGAAIRADGSQAHLDVLAADDAERLREITAWTATNARSPEAAAIVAKLGQVPARQRGAVLKAEAAKYGVSPCLLAMTLDAPPPSVPGADSPHQATPNFTVLKVDGPSKDQLLLAHVITTRVASGINSCYANALALTPTLEGKLVLKVTYDAAGHVTGAVDDGSTVKGAVVSCVGTAMFAASMATPLPESGKNGAVLTVTMQLTPTTTGPGYGASVDPAWQGKTTQGKGGARHR